MKKFRSITLVTALLYIAPAFASTNEYNTDTNAISTFEVTQAINLLIKARVLDAADSELVVKRPSVLEELRLQGYVEDGHVQLGAICAK